MKIEEVINMKIEEVIKQLESIADHTRSMAASPDADDIWKEDIDALEFALTALRSMPTLTPPNEPEHAGLYGKYTIYKNKDGSLVTDCFILRPAKDPAAVAALRAYAAATDNAELAADIINWVGAKPNEALTLDQLREMDGQPVYWPEDESWGIVSVDSAGKWAGQPFFRGRKQEVNFEYDIESRGMEVYSYPPAHIDRSEWTAEWIYPENEWNLPRCSKCGCNSKDATYGHKDRFCPKCGRAMTDDAVQIVMQRLKKVIE